MPPLNEGNAVDADGTADLKTNMISAQKAVDTTEQAVCAESLSDLPATRKVANALNITGFVLATNITPFFIAAFTESILQGRPTAKAFFMAAGILSFASSLSVFIVRARLWMLQRRGDGCSEHFAKFIDSHDAWVLVGSRHSAQIYSWSGVVLTWGLLPGWAAVLELPAYMQQDLWLWTLVATGLLSFLPLYFAVRVVLSFGRCSDASYASGCYKHAANTHEVELITVGKRC